MVAEPGGRSRGDGTSLADSHLPSPDKALELSWKALQIPQPVARGLPFSHEKRHMSYKVLVVDDSKLARMVMASAFRRIRPEWLLVETANADEALAAVGTVDIALIDFNMPGTDGLELIARIRKSHPGMPVAVVSANIQDEIIGRARELNAGFIPKPLTDEALAAFLSGATLRLKKAAL
jgi:CheY-like chemotaxis protein